VSCQSRLCYGMNRLVVLGAEEDMYLDLTEGAIRVMEKTAQYEALLIVFCTIIMIRVNK